MKLPVKIAEDISNISPGWLRENGFKIVLSDLDNTLAGYHQNSPDDNVSSWISLLASEGISLMIISNAKEERVAAFCNPLGLPYLSCAGKPSGKRLKYAVECLGGSPEEAVMIGDQFFTDILAARNAGIQAVLVEPYTKGFWFALRRWAEAPFIILFGRR